MEKKKRKREALVLGRGCTIGPPHLSLRAAQLEIVCADLRALGVCWSQPRTLACTRYRCSVGLDGQCSLVEWAACL
jgi:hypothetical protein